MSLKTRLNVVMLVRERVRPLVSSGTLMTVNYLPV